MKINKLNYENFVIDYIEGNLSRDQKEAFDFFIKGHPEVYDEIKDFMSAPILKVDESITFENKEALLMKSSSFSFLWILIPLLCIGTGFLFFFNQTEEVPKAKKEEIIQSIPMATNLKTEENIEGGIIESAPIVKEERVEEERVEEKTEEVIVAVANQIKPTASPTKIFTKPVISSSNVAEKVLELENAGIVQVAVEKEEQIITQIEREELSKIIPLENQSADLNSSIATKEINMNFSNKIILKKSDDNWKDLREAFATNAWKEVDLRDALTSESVSDFMKEKKILKSFIPETFTKK